MEHQSSRKKKWSAVHCNCQVMSARLLLQTAQKQPSCTSRQPFGVCVRLRVELTSYCRNIFSLLISGRQSTYKKIRKTVLAEGLVLFSHLFLWCIISIQICHFWKWKRKSVPQCTFKYYLQHRSSFKATSPQETSENESPQKQQWLCSPLSASCELPRALCRLHVHAREQQSETSADTSERWSGKRDRKVLQTLMFHRNRRQELLKLFPISGLETWNTPWSLSKQIKKSFERP